MGKVFITDEVNDSYTADVTSGSKLKVEVGAGSWKGISSAHTTVSAQQVNDGGCYLSSIIIGTQPLTAGSIQIYDTYGSASNCSAFGTSGDNIVVSLGVEPSAASGFSVYPKVIPINVYLTTGLCIGMGVSGSDSSNRVGNIKDVTVVYQA